jgi:hypothetical protein
MGSIAIDFWSDGERGLLLKLTAEVDEEFCLTDHSCSTPSSGNSDGVSSEKQWRLYRTNMSFEGY